MTKPKMSALVAYAIRNLREVRGSTSKEIMNYIKSQCTNGSDSSIQKQVILIYLIYILKIQFSFLGGSKNYIYILCIIIF